MRRVAPAFLLLFVLPGCAALQGLAALSQVRFAIEGVSGVRLAGVPVERIHSFEQISAGDLFRISSALAAGEVPLTFHLDLTAANPQGNPEARLVALEWALLLAERETVNGKLERALRFPSGEVTPFPLEIHLDLREFFEGGARDLVELALGVAGYGEGVDLRLRAIPTLDTPIGPIRYPEPLILVAPAFR